MTQTMTSRESYHKLSPLKVDSECIKILSFLQKWGALHFFLTDIAKAVNLPVNVVWSRVNTLEQRKQVQFDGVHYNQRTMRNAQTWKATKQ